MVHGRGAGHLHSIHMRCKRALVPRLQAAQLVAVWAAWQWAASCSTSSSSAATAVLQPAPPLAPMPSPTLPLPKQARWCCISSTNHTAVQRSVAFQRPPHLLASPDPASARAGATVTLTSAAGKAGSGKFALEEIVEATGTPQSARRRNRTAFNNEGEGGAQANAS